LAQGPLGKVLERGHAQSRCAPARSPSGARDPGPRRDGVDAHFLTLEGKAAGAPGRGTNAGGGLPAAHRCASGTGWAQGQLRGCLPAVVVAATVQTQTQLQPQGGMRAEARSPSGGGDGCCRCGTPGSLPADAARLGPGCRSSARSSVVLASPAGRGRPRGLGSAVLLYSARWTCTSWCSCLLAWCLCACRGTCFSPWS